MELRADDAERGLRHVLWSVRAFLPELVLIGGWVPYLYRSYGGFAEWRSELSGTTELDLLISPPTTRADGETLPAVLRRARFEERAEGAVWERGDPRARIEFMTSHRGTARSRNEVIAVEGQDGLGAIALDGLSMLHDFSTTLSLPVGRLEGAAQTVEVRVPTLGAYVVNKALTFPYRPVESGEGVGPKRAKDILYLRDLMAAGNEVVERIETSLRDMARAGSASDVEHARSNVYLVLNGGMRRYLSEAAGMLAERDRLSSAAAEAEMEGHLRDLYEVLGEAAAAS
jgi:hypothetical protein